MEYIVLVKVSENFLLLGEGFARIGLDTTALLARQNALSHLHCVRICLGWITLASSFLNTRFNLLITSHVCPS